ncbi:protease [Vibrio sp. 10N.286.55.E10]|uniref:S8 family peptidase n=1 Tax=unclassified Vibrio TaxID=2614977 RepID=UPI000C853872|nr:MULTISPECIES: S8 family peptidase [unclassified Vibrio]PME26472.1 protease [Vibrio sp. 10N.286.55.E12]PME30833.1 protease [Vibrio sp. 10N.286.55.E10]PME69016.1 protease [Vibrio sp. 10N.286.55.C11]PTP12763.1 protease [Vibrio sp. 10N.286.51.C3]TKE65041.1 protease [Vibrio sp. F12]
MNHGHRLTTLSLAIMASAQVSASALNESSPEPQPANSPFIQDVKGTIVEDYSRETILPSFFSMRMMSNADEQRGDWFNLTASYTRIQGVGSDVVYDYLMPPLQPQPVIVAVLDSGVDVEHEDLKNKLWTNEDEIPDNGIDDDGNGYIDDVHGWNFLGNSLGINVNQDTLEVTREYKKYLELKENGHWIPRKKREYYQDVESDYLSSLKDDQDALNRVTTATDQANEFKEQILQFVDQKDFSTNGLKTLLDSENASVVTAAEGLLSVFDSWYSFEYLESRRSRYQDSLDFHLNLELDTRGDIVWDDISNPWEKGYGNNDVKGPVGSHGTHVAGIIAAERNNSVGIDGVADHAQIMAVRMVPNGDERDKDIANAVRYAVDNGAKIINMSFGKSYSPRKYIVDHAFRYAARKGVLIVHSAGNSRNDNDIKPSFPNRYAKHYRSKPISTWLDVGASAKYADETLVASFSNFGQKSVDVFAPGYRILSTTPGNTYGSKSGTSMAAPVVSGVAALVWSRYPDLSVKELKAMLMGESKVYPELLVKKPSSPEDLVPFNTLSISGSIVDAEAIFAELETR